MTHEELKKNPGLDEDPLADPLADAVLYLLKAHREALEAQGAQFDAQAQQIRWGSDQLPPGVNRQATADQLLEAAAKIREETAVIEKLEDPLVLDPYSADDDDLLHYHPDSKGDSP